MSHSKYEDHENEVAVGAMLPFLKYKNPYCIIFLEIHVRSLLGLCVPGVTEGPKASKKALAHL